MGGKAYANKKQAHKQPEGNFYPTPKSLIWVAEHIIKQEFTPNSTILEPCCGNGMISMELEKMGYTVKNNDLFTQPQGVDYLTMDTDYPYVISNPPFSLWDEFVKHAKKTAQKIMFIGRLNYFGTHSRLISGVWENLKSVYCFDRYVDYRTPEREDGKFHVGAMATGWFIWDMEYVGLPSIQVLSVQKYAVLGNKT